MKFPSPLNQPGGRNTSQPAPRVTRQQALAQIREDMQTTQQQQTQVSKRISMLERLQRATFGLFAAGMTTTTIPYVLPEQTLAFMKAQKIPTATQEKILMAPIATMGIAGGLDLGVTGLSLLAKKRKKELELKMQELKKKQITT